MSAQVDNHIHVELTKKAARNERNTLAFFWTFVYYVS